MIILFTCPFLEFWLNYLILSYAGFYFEKHFLKKMLFTHVSLADGIHKYPCLFSASSPSIFENFRALRITLLTVERKTKLWYRCAAAN